MSARTPNNGLPYYCATCGLGFAEYMACEEPHCRLETEAAARERKASFELAKAVSP